MKVFTKKMTKLNKKQLLVILGEKTDSIKTMGDAIASEKNRILNDEQTFTSKVPKMPNINGIFYKNKEFSPYELEKMEEWLKNDDPAMYRRYQMAKYQIIDKPFEENEPLIDPKATKTMSKQFNQLIEIGITDMNQLK